MPHNLGTLNTDIVYLILSELDISSRLAVAHLAQTSRALREAALPFVHRHLVLKTGSVKKIRDDAEECVSKHVRTITVKDKIPEKDLIFVLERIAQHGRLRTLW